jgi:DNA repair exonuclease SbcCD ATPase subunit
VQGLDEVAGELYALPPDDFRTAREERAAQARAAGDKALAREIAALRRPVVSAWLVNMLAREAPGQMDELLALGESLRDAQQALDGDRLRELSTQRRDLVAAMVNEAKRIAGRAGRPVSLQVEREVEATLQAALADPEAATEVSSGRLASPLTYAGLGAGGATRLRPVRQARREPPAAAGKEPALRVVPGDGAEPRAARTAEQRAAREAAVAERREREAAATKQAAEQAVADAAGAADAARAALDDAERTAASARAAQEAVRQRAEQLDRELSEALAEQSRATRAVRDAQRGRETAARALDAATKRLARARQAATRLSGSPGDTPAGN